MFFCKSCSKLLDEDLKVCPYCGAVEEESFLDSYSNILNETENTIPNMEINSKGVPAEEGEAIGAAVPLDSGAAEDTPFGSSGEAGIIGGSSFNSDSDMGIGESMPLGSDSGGNSLDSTINKINEMIDKNLNNKAGVSEESEHYQLSSSSSSFPPSSGITPPDSGSAYSSGPGGQSGGSAFSDDEDVPTGTKVALILLSVFISIAGIVVGAVYMSKSKPKYKAFGKIMLIISIVVTVLSFLCCCAASYLIMLDYY